MAESLFRDAKLQVKHRQDVDLSSEALKVIVVGNRLGYSSSNPRRGRLYIT